MDAHARWLRKAAELDAVNKGPVLAPEGRGPRSVATAVVCYLADVKDAKKPKTLAEYATSLNYFTESCHKLYLEDIDRKDLLKFHAFLREEKEQAPHSCCSKLANVMSLLKAQGMRGLVGKNDRPRYREEEPEIYEQKELDKLFAACNAEERLWCQFFLMTGEREQDVMFTYWSDVNCTALRGQGDAQARPRMDAEGMLTTAPSPWKFPSPVPRISALMGRRGSFASPKSISLNPSLRQDPTIQLTRPLPVAASECCEPAFPAEAIPWPVLADGCETSAAPRRRGANLLSRACSCSDDVPSSCAPLRAGERAMSLAMD